MAVQPDLCLTWSADTQDRLSHEAIQIICDILYNQFMHTIMEACRFSSPEPKAHGELIVYQSSRRLCVCLSVSLSTPLNINISKTSGPIATKFYLKHHWGGWKAALGFEQDWNGTLVSMVTESSHWVIKGKILLAF